MTLKLPLDSSAEALISAVEKWVDLLAKDDYAAALAMIEHDKESEWTPNSLKEWIENYGDHEPHFSGKKFKVTPIEETSSKEGEKHNRDFDYLTEPVYKEKYNAEIIADIWYDLPLNNEWSDLTAAFFILKRDGYLTLILNDVHVM